MGRVLGWVLGYEAQDRDRLLELGAPQLIAHTFIEAVQWSTELAAGLVASRLRENFGRATRSMM